MAVIELSDSNFQSTVDGNDLLILDFWAPWCGPCRNFAPIFEEVSEKFTDVVFGKINTEEEQKLASYFSIRSIPTLIVIREGIILDQVSGSIPSDALEQAVTRAREIDMDEVKKQIEAEEQK